jgi:hypothetical protein
MQEKVGIMQGARERERDPAATGQVSGTCCSGWESGSCRALFMRLRTSTTFSEFALDELSQITWCVKMSGSSQITCCSIHHRQGAHQRQRTCSYHRPITMQRLCRWALVIPHRAAAQGMEVRA